jgi:serine protease Do
MKITLVLLFGLLIFAGVADAQKLPTGKEIYGTNCKAVVQIQADGGFGNGFIVSADGIIMTANHVVTTRESRFRQYAKEIDVAVDGHAVPYKATPLIAEISDDQVNYDSSLIKITVASQLPHVTLGKWNEVDVGERLTIIPSWPGIGCIALEGIIAKTAPVQTILGPKPVNTILFQSPVRNGFSGSPIFSSKGNVVGIVDTKVFGISQALDAVRQQLAVSSAQSTVIIQGISFAPTMTELINVLDQNLISGLGTGVAVDHAKQLQAQANKK